MGVAAIPGKEYLVYFPESGEVELDLDGTGKQLTVNRVDALIRKWHHDEILNGTGKLILKSPGKHVIFLIN